MDVPEHIEKLVNAANECGELYDFSIEVEMYAIVARNRWLRTQRIGDIAAYLSGSPSVSADYGLEAAEGNARALSKQACQDLEAAEQRLFMAVAAEKRKQNV